VTGSRPAVVLVAGGAWPATASLCGRPAVDWLLDSVEALAPAAVTVIGAGAGPVRERIALRPALQRCAGVPAEPDGVELVVPCSLPLLRPAFLRRAVESLATGGLAPRAVVLVPARRAAWWAEPASTGGPLAFAVRGSIGLAAGELAIAATGGTAPVRSASRLLAGAGAQVRTARLAAVESLWLDDPVDRAEAANALYARIAAGWQERGVIIDDAGTTRIDAAVALGDGVRILPHTELAGATIVGRGSRIGPMTTVRDCRIGEECLIQYAVCQDTDIDDGANVGPFTWLRSGTRLGARCRAGAYVEVADSTVGEGTSIPHLAGLFSADVGRNGNFGSMAGPANFDGTHKHRSRFGDDVSIGSGTILVAPVSVGDGASTAAGSVITGDVPDGALAIARTPQRNVTGWARRQQPPPRITQ
jgi:bifunctional N-acetylglucosamine-1-phosphate-uridyltransferase/glucosamine-1-phosphate-acetyltransferase GlmU-like protein